MINTIKTETHQSNCGGFAQTLHDSTLRQWRKRERGKRKEKKDSSLSYMF